MSFTKKMISVACLLAAAATSTFAAAQAYPSKPIRLIVPFPPGGLIDTMARIIVPPLSKELGQPIVVENKPGAGGNLGPVELAKSPADGYTLLMASPPLSINPALYKNLPYKPADVQTVAIFGQLPNVLLVNPEAGINSVAELVAKAKSAPGKLNYGSNGNGTSLHLSAELMKSLGGIHLVHISYRGSAMANLAVMAKEIDLMFDNLPPALPHINSGKLKALAVTSAKRHPMLPTVPTMQEAGFAGYQVAAWFGVAVQRGTPADVNAKLQEALRKVLSQKELTAAIAARGVTVELMDERQSSEFMKADTARWEKVAKYAGITLE